MAFGETVIDRAKILLFLLCLFGCQKEDVFKYSFKK